MRCKRAVLVVLCGLSVARCATTSGHLLDDGPTEPARQQPARAILLAIVALVGAPLTTVSAQSPPKRPRLSAGADTNSARAYYDRGVDLLTQDAWTAAAAFYWASRLEPGWAEAFYARRVAGLMAQEHILMGYLEGVRSVIDSRHARRLDSLEYQAERINPFFLRNLDEQLYAGYLVAAYKRERSRSAEQPLDPRNEAELRYLVDLYLRSGTNLSIRAALAASQRRFSEALELYRNLLPQYRVKAPIRAERARIFYTITAYDSALAELQAALTELRQLDTARLTTVYVSREQLEHSIGMTHEAAGDTAAARAAYGRALQENLAYSPAHVRLANLDILRGDTVTALSEWDLAVQVAPTEAPPRVAYGMLLARTGRLEDAVLHLRRATEIEPYYATPHYVLGVVAELQGNLEAALEGYRAFLARASAHDRLRSVVTQRVTDLTY